MVSNSILAGDFVVLVLSILGTILNTSILISILRKKYCQKQQENKEESPNNKKNSTLITNSSILCIVFYLIFAFLAIVAYSKLIFIDAGHGNITTARIMRIGACFYIFSNNGLLLFILLLRMNHLSIYPLFFKKITYILPIITSIMVTTPFILSIIDTKSAEISHNLTIIATMIVIIIYIILMILYLKQISFVMKQRIIISKTDENKTNNFDGISEKGKEVEVIIDFNTIQNTVRYSVLVIFCVSSTLSVPIWTSIGRNALRDPTFISFIAGIGLINDAIINSISTFFLFGFVKIYYFKFCNICHQFVNNCCIFCVIKSFKENIDKEQYKSLILAE